MYISVCERVYFLTGYQFHIHGFLFGFGQQIRVVDGFYKGRAQRLDMIRRCIGRGHHWPGAELRVAGDDGGEAARCCRGLILVHQFVQGRHIR